MRILILALPDLQASCGGREQCDPKSFCKLSSAAQPYEGRLQGRTWVLPMTVLVTDCPRSMGLGQGGRNTLISLSLTLAQGSSTVTPLPVPWVLCNYRNKGILKNLGPCRSLPLVRTSASVVLHRIRAGGVNGYLCPITGLHSPGVCPAEVKAPHRRVRSRRETTVR